MPSRLSDVCLPWCGARVTPSAARSVESTCSRCLRVRLAPPWRSPRSARGGEQQRRSLERSSPSRQAGSSRVGCGLGKLLTLVTDPRQARQSTPRSRLALVSSSRFVSTLSVARPQGVNPVGCQRWTRRAGSGIRRAGLLNAIVNRGSCSSASRGRTPDRPPPVLSSVP